MNRRKNKIRPAKLIALVIALIAVSVGIGIRQLWLEGVFSGPQVSAQTQSVESEAVGAGDTQAKESDPAERFFELLAQGTDSPEKSPSSPESTAATGNVRLALMVLITLCISVLGLFAAILVNYRVSGVAETASQAVKLALTEQQKHRILELADRMDTFVSRLGEFEKKTGIILEQLSGLQTNLDVLGRDVQENTLALTEVREDLAQFGHFKSDVEEIHRRLADAYRLTQDIESADRTLPDEQNTEESDEDVADSPEDTGEWTSRYGYPLAG